jgi:hypothetical protein
MDLLRKLIVERITANGCSGLWLLDAYHYLLGHGASSADAIKALESFVDEAIVMKAAKKREPVA